MAKKTNQIINEVRQELRGIIRLIEDLRIPLQRFESLEPPPEHRPGYYVTFDQRPRRMINGLRLGRLGSLTLPDERITDQTLESAKAVWHLKDRLHQLAKTAAVHTDVEAYAEQSPEMTICADLANLKKHGRNENRSRLDPHLGEVQFDTSRSGAIELFYDGATKEKELLVSNPTPIPFMVEVKLGTGASISNAVDILSRAARHWIPLIRALGVLTPDDPETTKLRQRLSQVL